jgi:capsular exopolysaccharide synthesis family protein
VSRIFDAMRRFEKENTGTAVSTPWTLQTLAEQPLSSVEERQGDFDHVERLAPRITPDKHILALGDRDTPGAEKFRVLRHRLQKIRADHPFKKLLISSAVPREGKTLVALNLAFSLAKLSARVLIVDADLRHPGVHEVLGLEPRVGLSEYLQGKIDEYKAVCWLDPWKLYYLPAGRCPETPGELLQGGKVGGLLKKLGEAFDWVIVDTAPITLFADTPHLANFADAALLVTRLGITTADTVEQALLALEGHFIAGVVMNGDTKTGSPSYGSYNYYMEKGNGVLPDEEETTEEKG